MYVCVCVVYIYVMCIVFVYVFLIKGMPNRDDSGFLDKKVTFSGGKKGLEKKINFFCYLKSYQMMIMPVTLKLNSTTTRQ